MLRPPFCTTLFITMKKLILTLTCFSTLTVLAACATVQPNNIREVNDTVVKGCRLAGPVHGSDAIFVGLSASVGSKNAKARAMNEAVRLQATDVVWSQQGTSMTNEWVGKAYVCK
jgi:starvation-inducible outer membrane lipoprotein